MIPKQEGDKLVSTEGVIGSNGNILLFGLGNIQAANRSLDDVRTEIRNILIRNGLAPNFQLEINNFNSQKVFVADSNGNNNTIPLNSIPISLKEIALEYGISASNENFATIKLTRKNQEFRFTASQLFESTAPEIILKDKDQIKIQISSESSKIIISTVGSKGNIILGGVGSISAVNRTLDDIYQDISKILVKQGVKPSFQLELTKFASKKAYLIQKNVGSKVVALTNSKNTLRELILNNAKTQFSTPGLSVITLKRNENVFRMNLDKILDPRTQDIWIVDEDQIELETLAYKPGQVFALSGAGNTNVFPIDPSRRETLADILFAKNGALNNLRAKRSEVYLLRGKNPSTAYHLDTQNVSRILVAAKTELRPNDIVYVADRPIISFSRTLSEILPLRILLRDIQNNNIP
jgi:polysaccharide export outer membrane protein